MPPGSGAGLAELGEAGHARLLTVTELREIIADISAATSWDGWLAAMHRSRQRLDLLHNHSRPTALQSTVTGTSQTVQEITMVMDTKIYTLKESILIMDALSAALAGGLRLLCAQKHRRWLMVADATHDEPVEVVTTLASLISASANAAFHVQTPGAESHEAAPSTGKLHHAGVHTGACPASAACCIHAHECTAHCTGTS